MNDWQSVSEADAKRIKSGGTWAYVHGKLVPISAPAIAEQLREQVPALLRGLSDQLAVESEGDIEDIRFEVSKDMDTVTVTMIANGHEATRSLPLTGISVQ